MTEQTYTANNATVTVNITESSASAGTTENAVPNVAELRNLSPSVGDRVIVSCHTFPGFGGGAFIATDDDCDDDGGSCIRAANGLCMKRDWGTGDVGNILFWGADPTGKTGSSDAIQRAIDSGLTGTIVIPSEGVFLIDRQVSFYPLSDDGSRDTDKPLRMVMRSDMWSHFGKFRDRAAIKPSPELDGVMFDGAYNVFGMAFFGPDNAVDGNSYHAIHLDSYVNKVQHCTFNVPNDAIRVWAGANIDISDCHFIGCDKNIHAHTDSLATTYRVAGCLSQYCTHLMYSKGQLWGSVFENNTWEVCRGSMVVGAVLFNIGFTGNWIEGGGGESEPVKIARTLDAQQFKNCWSAGNSFHGGNWINTFESDVTDEGYSTASGGMGGVSFDHGALQVNNQTGNSTLFSEHGMTQRLDGWSGWKPFRIESGRNHHGAPALQLRASRDVEITGSSDTESGNATPFSGALRFLKSEDTYDELRINHDPDGKMSPGLLGSSTVESGNALISVPVDVYCHDSGLQRGQEAFSSVDRTTEGQVVFTTPYAMANPVVTVTVEDRGIVCDGYLLSGPNGETGNNGQSRWRNYLTVYFVDRNTGEPKTPDGFSMRLSFHK